MKNPVKRYWFVNVLFDDIVKPLLNERGMSLTKDGLTARKLGDHALFETVGIKYKGTKEEYSYLLNGFKKLIPSQHLHAVTWSNKDHLAHHYSRCCEKAFVDHA